MANVENINRLIELLRTDESAKRFNMGNFFNFNSETDREPICGTAACIAGHACLLKYPNAMVSRNSGYLIVSENYTDSPGHVAKDFLGLNWNQAEWLFYGRFTTVFSLSDITVDHAIKALEHIRDGKPVRLNDWDWVMVEIDA